MNQSLPCLHPNPGWTGAHSTTPTTLQSVSGPSTTDTVGKHCILELYDCTSAKLNDEAFLRTAITTAAKRAGATLLNLITHHFDPQGVTGLALLAESHISIHTWPESGYAAVDVFTCGDHTMPELACAVLCEELEARTHKLTSFRRETPECIAGADRDPILAAA
ncbi:adenosylmethionine decarboxylase [Synechococcus sp. CS-1328]|uniref:adenosylmethionine decarboxylase n=1 Tax=Synechococcus sp. CS-1328 TaxID=2847976 RepID=UPI00223B9A4D|nr:adenosylmethionine decarboxylase [Synechococcus sp. CS-1328]MCT0225387.1 adenosylmethionine decarboxylase [Synechococcus sp. CS-1328]